jgi:hypothetical protein
MDSPLLAGSGPADPGIELNGDGAVAAGDLIAVAMADRLSAPLTEEVAR